MTFILKTCVCKALESNLKGQVRFYSRWAHRTPKRVFLSQEELEASESSVKEKERAPLETVELKPEEVADYKKINWKHSREKPVFKQKPKISKLIDMEELDKKSEVIDYKIKLEHTSSKKFIKPKKIPGKQETTDMLEIVIDAEGNFVYHKLKDNDPTISGILTTVKSRKQQTKKDLVLLEGKRLIKEALENKCILKYLLFSRKSDVEWLKPYLPKSGAKLYKMAYRELQMWSDLTTSPGVMGIFKTPEVENFVPTNSIPLTIICDNVREPGNLGAILRVASGVETKSIVLTKGCVDLWDTKVLRAAAGAHFRSSIHRKTNWSDIIDKIDANTSIFIADNNVATENVIDPSKNSKNNSMADTEQTDSESDTTETEKKSLVEIVESMPVVPYYSVDFKVCDSIVLIVGGETEGISEESYRMAAKYNGVRLNIPLGNGIESLNTGTALGIISFEIKRQLLALSDIPNDSNNSENR